MSANTDWSPVGVDFFGVIDGNGHTFTISDNKAGYFSSLVGYNHGIIQNIKVHGTETISFTQGGGVSHSLFAGLVFGNCYDGIIRNCVFYGTVSVPRTYESRNNINGRGGIIVGESSSEENIVSNCYWCYNCLRTNTNGTDFNPTDDANWLVAKTLNIYTESNIRQGTYTGNGSFPSNTDGTLTPANATDAVTEQMLQYGTNLLTALNGYVNDHSGDQLCSWISGTSYSAIPSIFAE